jgi:hypothetical protein
MWMAPLLDWVMALHSNVWWSDHTRTCAYSGLSRLVQSASTFSGYGVTCIGVKIYEFILKTRLNEQLLEAIFTSFLIAFGWCKPCRGASIKGVVLRLYSHETACFG